MAYNSKYTGAQVDAMFDLVNAGSTKCNSLILTTKITPTELTKTGVNFYVLKSSVSSSCTLESVFSKVTTSTYTHKYINDSSTAVQYNKATLFHTVLNGTTMYTIIDGTI